MRLTPEVVMGLTAADGIDDMLRDPGHMLLLLHNRILGNTETGRCRQETATESVIRRELVFFQSASADSFSRGSRT